MQNINAAGKIYARPWGTYKTLELGSDFQVKKITVNPQGRLSLQKHSQRVEHWIVVEGTPTITIGENTKIYQAGDSVFIAKETPHRMENLTENPASIIEVQLGSYLGEDDIVRLEDIYGRV